jgi:hypothetical protein
MDACIARRRLAVRNGMPPAGDGCEGMVYGQEKIVCLRRASAPTMMRTAGVERARQKIGETVVKKRLTAPTEVPTPRQGIGLLKAHRPQRSLQVMERRRWIVRAQLRCRTAAMSGVSVGVGREIARHQTFRKAATLSGSAVWCIAIGQGRLFL